MARSRRFPCASALIVCTGAALCVQRAQAGDTRWVSPAGGLFGDPLNWTAGPPQLGDRGIFDLDAALLVTTAAEARFRELALRGGVDLTLDLSQGALFLETDLIAQIAGNLTVGETAGDVATLTVDRGQVRGVFGSLGRDPGSFGGLTLRDPDAAIVLTNDFTVGQQGEGMLHLSRGAQLFTGDAFLGRVSQSGIDGFRGKAAVRLTGPGTKWTVNSQMWIGGGTQSPQGGSVDFDILDGAVLDVGAASIAPTRRSRVRLRIAGQNTQWFGSMLIGGRRQPFRPITAPEIGGIASVLVADGAFAEAVCLDVGHLPRSRGDLTITGAGTRFSAGFIEPGLFCNAVVGFRGHGSISVLDGARFDAAESLVLGLGLEAGSARVVADGPGSTITTASFFMGSSSSVVVTGGARAEAGELTVGTQFLDGFHLLGSVDVSQPGSELVVGEFNGNTTRGSGVLALGFARATTGTLTIADGAVVRANFIFIGGLGVGNVMLSPHFFSNTNDGPGGQLVAEVDPDKPNSGIVVIGGGVPGHGRLTLAGRNDTVRAGTVFVSIDGELVGRGVVDADVENGGFIRPTNEMSATNEGRLTVLGDYAQAEDGTLFITPGGATNARLIVEGEAALDGALEVALGVGSPPPNKPTELLTAGSVTGRFSDVTFPQTLDGTRFFLDYLDTAVFIVPLTVPCDLTGEGAVDAYDLAILLANWGKRGVDALRADIDQDGVVGVIDLATLLTHMTL